MPVRLISNVRGMGVAVSVKTSTPVWSFLIISLCVTPKRCSSSTTNRPQPFEPQVFRQQSMGADDEVDLAGSNAGNDLLRLSRREESRQHLDPDRVAGEPLAEGLVVLLRQQRRRHEDRHLLAVLDRLERGAQRDLGLAEADVSDQQPVHRLRLFHIGFHVVDSDALVGRLLVREGGFELSLPRCVDHERVTGCRQAALVEHDELLRDLPYRRLDPRAGALPIGAAHARQRGRITTGVVTDHVDLVGRHVELVVTAVGQQQVVALHTSDRPRDHAFVLRDAMRRVHHIVAGLEILEDAVRGTTA